MRARLIPAVLALLLVATGCSSDPDESTSSDETGTGRPEAAAPIDPTRSRADVECSPEALDDQNFEFRAAHDVVAGVLGATCLGEPDPTLTQAWDDLAAITPPGQLVDLALFGGFDARDEGEEVTLAYVNTLTDEGDLFQMSVNLEAYDEDRDQALLTMAHEFSHVFASLPSELDRTIIDPSTCPTYDNGEGCYEDRALMWAWIQEFWGDGLIEEIDPEAEATAAAGQGRCDADDGFFGAYAASSPEEDFAESFSAYVFQVEAETDGQQARLDWLAAQPGLVEFRDRAEAAGLGPLDNDFDRCG